MENLKSLKHIYYKRNKEDILCWYKGEEIKVKHFLVHYTNMVNYIKKDLRNYNLIGIKSDSAYFKLVAFYSLLYLEKECCPYEVLEIEQNNNHIIITEKDVNFFENIEDIIDITDIYNIDFDNNKIAIKLLSSGTSGQNKIISLSFNNITMNLNQFNKTNMYNDKDICISFFDMYHIYGIYAFILFLPWQHIPFVLLDKMTDSESYHNYIKNYNITIIHTVPCLLQLIKTLDNTNVRYIACSSSSLNSYEHEYQEKRLKVPIYQLYGCTECSPLITLQTPETRVFGGIGKMLDDIEFKI
jgi:long-subunit acyl-CoA synthetase (AMP-forming)